MADSGTVTLRRDHCFAFFSSLKKSLEHLAEAFLLLKVHAVWSDVLRSWAVFISIFLARVTWSFSQAGSCRSACGPLEQVLWHALLLEKSSTLDLGFVFAGCHFARLIDTRGSL